MITDGVHTENTEGNGGPQADFVGERESSDFKQILNGCPQADSFGERQLENEKCPRRTRRTRRTRRDVRKRTVLEVNSNCHQLDSN